MSSTDTLTERLSRESNQRLGLLTAEDPHATDRAWLTQAYADSNLTLATRVRNELARGASDEILRYANEVVAGIKQAQADCATELDWDIYRGSEGF